MRTFRLIAAAASALAFLSARSGGDAENPTAAITNDVAPAESTSVSTNDLDAPPEMQMDERVVDGVK